MLSRDCKETWTWKQAPDLTDFSSGLLLKGIEPKKDFDTEFACNIITDFGKDKTKMEKFKALGFRQIAVHSNLYQAHTGSTYGLHLMWAKIDGIGPKRDVERAIYGPGTSYEMKDGVRGGCGLRFGDAGAGKLSYFYKRFNNFFSLIRIPLKQVEIYRRTLAVNHFMFIEAGKEAAFFCNGWKPDEWSYAKQQEWYEATKGKLTKLEDIKKAMRFEMGPIKGGK